jgi:hypothetical protein
MFSGSDQLSRLFVMTPDGLDYHPDLCEEQRSALEHSVPEDWLKNADV